MESKVLELRDRGTFMPVLAVALIGRNVAETYLLRRAGFSGDLVAPELFEGGERYVILIKLDGVEAQYDVYAWPSRARTLPVAHQHIIANWTTLKSGDVIDVQFLLQESTGAKQSERLTHPL